MVGEERERLVRELERSLFHEWVLVEGFFFMIALVTSEDMEMTFLETGSGMGKEARNERGERGVGDPYDSSCPASTRL